VRGTCQCEHGDHRRRGSEHPDRDDVIGERGEPVDGDQTRRTVDEVVAVEVLPVRGQRLGHEVEAALVGEQGDPEEPHPDCAHDGHDDYDTEDW
jgi:hypothetical protein